MAPCRAAVVDGRLFIDGKRLTNPIGDGDCLVGVFTLDDVMVVG